MRDWLTQFLDEDLLDDMLRREMARARRHGEHLSLILLEAHCREEIRKEVAYPILKQFARLVKAQTRVEDLGFRLRNRILLLLPETDPFGVRSVAEKISKVAGEQKYLARGGCGGVQVEVKCGMATFPQDGEIIGDLLETLNKDIEIPWENKSLPGRSPEVEVPK